MNIDPISDMLTRIRNAQAVGHKTVSFAYSKIKLELVNILNKEGYIGDIKESGKGSKKEIEVNLKYKDARNTVPKIQGLLRISRSGQRIYATKKELINFSQGRGLIILTTSLGFMTDKEARKKGVGGEIICRVF
ncbi:MAG TPA: 30S ribosomal protein S8 [Candidatus Portnoybacteria bacterium]|jgi:small subunit ribosomal protein S8|nr:30S ribosomal protein S8 [Candidatus Portnoybacteria bacterium]MDD5751939.1 30S ribosomal protein S8 [Candidatus Portnoybacteria bacterium]HNU96699.1 30S ribosomal protein S8 [Candidatus Portnoybacteria bacterium]HOZ16257.1 30S ribosomal protein S8 [Candidatus Portnoybacteria bacterium]HPH51947.1 30S ribosomal protein S8 [Candidatus Portnoybacteria bacterium]